MSNDIQNIIGDESHIKRRTRINANSVRAYGDCDWALMIKPNRWCNKQYLKNKKNKKVKARALCIYATMTARKDATYIAASILFS